MHSWESSTAAACQSDEEATSIPRYLLIKVCRVLEKTHI